MQQQQSDVRLRPYRLWRQALSGDTEGAMASLENDNAKDMPILAADLLARLYVRAGRLAEARSLWGQIVQLDPDYGPAVAALKKLNSTWLVRAVVRQYSRWFGMGLLVTLALFGIFILFARENDGSFLAGGLIALLAVFTTYLAGFFAWAYLTVESLFGLYERLDDHLSATRRFASRTRSAQPIAPAGTREKE